MDWPTPGSRAWTPSRGSSPASPSGSAHPTRSLPWPCSTSAACAHPYPAARSPDHAHGSSTRAAFALVGPSPPSSPLLGNPAAPEFDQVGYVVVESAGADPQQLGDGGDAGVRVRLHGAGRPDDLGRHDAGAPADPTARGLTPGPRGCRRQ